MSCNSCSNVTLPGVAGPAGAVGDTGPQGSTGVFGGYSIEWQFESAITPAPTTGFLRLNDPTPASVTEIYIDETAKNSVNGANFLASIDDNGDAGNYGLIRIFKRGSSTIFWTGKVTASVDSGDYYTLTVTHISSSGTFTANDDVVVSFVANGKTGTNGTDGVSVIEVNMTPTSTTSNSFGSGAVQTVAINGTTLNFGDVDDFLKMKFSVIGDTTDNFILGLLYDWQVLYGSDTIVDTSSAHTIFRAGGYEDADSNGIDVEIDLVVTATDTITPIVRVFRSQAVRSDKFITSPLGGFNMVKVLPSVSISSPISGSNDLKLSVKNSDNSSTVDIVYFELVKYLK